MLAEYPAPSLTAVGTALPPNYADQETLTAALRAAWIKRGLNLRRFDQLQRAVQVSGRYLALPMAEYYGLDTFAKCNAAWIRIAPEVAVEAAGGALKRAGLSPRDVDHIFLVTVTGIATPSIDTQIISRLGMRSDIKRTPIFGLGCVAGAAGVARASDYVRAFPNEVAILVAVELCSLTLQREDLSVANLIASGLFGDGAAAVVISGGARGEMPGPRILATRSVLYPGTEDVMGWEIVDSGFKVVLTAGVPEIVKKHICSDVDGFLRDHGLERRQIKHWVAHTGGPRVLEAFESSLELPPSALERSWRSLKSTGNLSSASVLFVAGEMMADGAAEPGDYGLLMAMGPGFCSELVLLRW